MYNLWCFVALNGSKISFVAIYAVLSRIFCRDLRAFVWSKIKQKIVSVEKTSQISGIHSLLRKLLHTRQVRSRARCSLLVKSCKCNPGSCTVRHTVSKTFSVETCGKPETVI